MFKPFVDRAGGFLQTSAAGQQVAKLPFTFALVLLSSLFSLLASLWFKTVLANSNPVVSELAISPSDTFMRGKLWTVLTASLVEENFSKFLVFAALTLLASTKLEQELGSLEVTKLVVVSQALASTASALVFFATYFFTLDDNIFFSHVFGLGGVLVSLCVGLVKARPELRLAVLPTIVTYALLGLIFPLYDAMLVVLSFPPAVYLLSTETGEFSWRAFVRPELPGASSSTDLGSSSSSSALALAANDPTKARFRDRGFKLLDKKLAELEAAPEVSLDDSPPAVFSPTTTITQ
ncbi:hypothetical protein BASA81_000003 [Batrachochytrium salamandrivorans]|nr:hypothetical protein BASA81_000003 [Batrachochytrium salamandrivorans]